MSIMEILIGMGAVLFLGQLGHGLEYYFMHKKDKL